MAWVNQTANLLKIDDAKRRGFDVWEVWLSNWGNVGAGADVNSTKFPDVTANPGIILNGVYAAAIAPSSTVDRCQLLWNSGNPLDTSATQWPYYAMECSVRTPVRWSLPGGPIAYAFNPSAPVLPALQISAVAQLNLTPSFNDNFIAQTTAAPLFGDTYFPAGSTTAAPWGTALADDIFIQPQLRLLVWLRPPGGGLPTHRFPVQFQDLVQVDNATTELKKVVPVHGRRYVNVRARIRTTGADVGPFDISIGSVVNTRTGSVFDPVVPSEIMLTTTTNVASSASFTANYSNQELGFLTVYLNRTGATNADVEVIVTAED